MRNFNGLHFRCFSLGRFVLVAQCLISLSGCFQTRADIEEMETQRRMQEQVSTLQKTKLESDSRVDEIIDELKSTRNKNEILEEKINRLQKERSELQAKDQSQATEIDRKLALLTESLSKLDAQVQSLNAEVVKISEAQQKAQESNSASNNKTQGKMADYEDAEAAFKSKSWKSAITSYQKFREKNAKSKLIAEVTYKMGVCFQELGSNEDAASFYEDVVARFPKSDYSKKSQYRLKTIKK